jgi:hypothetical protein
MDAVDQDADEVSDERAPEFPEVDLSTARVPIF